MACNFLLVRLQTQTISAQHLHPVVHLPLLLSHQHDKYPTEEKFLISVAFGNLLFLTLVSLDVSHGKSSLCLPFLSPTDFNQLDPI